MQTVIFQHSGPERKAGPVPLSSLWPFWVLLVAFEAALWLLMALKFRQPCAPVALVAGLTLGVAVSSFGGRGLRGLLWATGLTAVVIGLALYGLAAFHVARVLGLAPLESLAGTGIGFARLVLAGLLERSDLAMIAVGLALAAAFGHGFRAGPARPRPPPSPP
ncbi:MAG: hypothetical protein KF823_08270 [Xanthomonadales bacterium]|nr:hypothetical protein [Xanthomonadales bacterium]